METPILKTKNIFKYYGSGNTEVKAVNNVSLDVMPGEIVLIMGPSGSGKNHIAIYDRGPASPDERQYRD